MAQALSLRAADVVRGLQGGLWGPLQCGAVGVLREV